MEDHLKKKSLIFPQSQPLWSSWVFFVCQMGKMPTFAKASHHLSKAFQHVMNLSMGKNSMETGVLRTRSDMFEGGNLLNLNLTPVTNIPWKFCNFTSCVTQLQSHTNQIYYFVFEGTVSICMCNIACTARAHMKKEYKLTQKKKALFLHGPSIIITWVMQFIIFKHVV